MATVLLLLLFAAPAAAQSDAAHQQFLFAYKLLQRGDDRLAAAGFDEYLGDFPQDEKRGDALYYRALLYRRAGQNRPAARMLADVPAPTLVPAYAVDLLRGQVLSDLGQYAEALASLERIDTQALEPTTAVSVLYLQGLAYRGAQNLPAAAERLTAAAALATPMQARALLDLARVQVLMNQPAEAIRTLDQCLAAAEAGTAAEAARLAGDLSYQEEAFDKAVSYYGSVITRHQSSRHFGPAVTGTLWAHFSAKRYRAVLDVFQQYREALPLQDRVAVWYLAGSAHQELGAHEQAAALFEQVAHGEGNQYPLQEKVLYKLAASQFALGQYDPMRKTLAELAQRFPQSSTEADAAYLLAAADAKQGDVARGAARLSALIDQGPEHPYYRASLLRRARLYEEHNQFAPAAADYHRYLQAAQQAGDTGPQARQTALRLVDLLYRLERFDEAAQAGETLLAQPNLDALTRQEALYRLALTQVRLNRAEPALATLATLQKDYPLNRYTAEADYYRGLLLMSLGRTDEAAPLLAAAGGQAKLAPALRANALRLVALRQRESEQASAARQSLRELEALAGRDALQLDERFWLARYELEHGEPAAALPYVAPLIEPAPGIMPETRAEAVYLTGRAQRAMGQHVPAAASFRQVIAMGRGFDLDARLELARTLADQGQLDAALNEFAGLISAGRSDIEAHAVFDSAVLHRRLAEQARRQSNTQRLTAANDEAYRLLKRLVVLYPFEQLEPLPQLAYLMLAEIDAERGEPAAAEESLRELVTNYPEGPYAQYGRAVLAADAQRYTEAVGLLRRLASGETSLDPRLAGRVEALLKVLEPKQ